METLDLYDQKKEKINKTFIRENGNPENGEYKQSVHIWIMNKNGEFLIEKRSDNMKKNPGKWAFVGGVPVAGESSVEGAVREVREEVGINLDIKEVELIISFKREHDFVDVWLAHDDTELKNIVMQETEVSKVKWVSLEQIDELISNQEFVPSINLYYELFIKLLYKCYPEKIKLPKIIENLYQ